MFEPLSLGLSKRVRKLQQKREREATGLFVAEGPGAVVAAVKNGELEFVIVGEDVVGPVRGLAEHASGYGITVYEATSTAIEQLSESRTPQGILGIARRPQFELAQVVDKSSSLVVVLEEARDPGNVGTIIRTADAAGADAVVLAGESVDPFNAKAVRSSAGSVFNIPVVTDVSTSAVVDHLGSLSIKTVATSLTGDTDLYDSEFLHSLQDPVAWFFGNEAHGLSKEVEAALNQRVLLPIYGQAESLNLAISTGICLYTTLQARS
ncbi:MAG: RNA methyltransferase [Candidatus Nanopelagicales bacterium]